MSGTTSTHDELREILVSREAERKALINTFMERRRPVFLRQSSILCTHFRLNRNTMFEDVAQIVAQAAFEMILDILNKPEQLDELGSYESVLKTRARYAVGAYLRSGAHTPMSGMSNVERRRMQIVKTRNALREELGHDPDDETVIDRTNERLIASTKDPRRSGFLVSQADLESNVRVGTLLDEVDYADPAAKQPDAHGPSGLHVGEHERFLDLVGARLARRPDSAVIDKVARHWLSVGLTEQVLTASEIAGQFDLDSGTSRNYLRTIKEISAAVLVELNTEN